MKSREPIAEPSSTSTTLSRRRTLGFLGAGVAALPLAGMNASPASAQPTWLRRVRTPTGWAVGGTRTLRSSRHYPDPFAYTFDTASTPTCEVMLGPCHDPLADRRSDISEGLPGLPMRFGIRVVDETGAPLAGANVDIWHCDTTGSYSSETADAPDFCTDGTERVLSARFFRGHQDTDERGVVWFESCMPGWYHGRAVHVHLIIRPDGIGGETHLTTQVTFPPTLVESVFAEHPDYVDHGLPDTPLEADLLLEPQHMDAFMMQTLQMTDGTLMAYKTIIVRSSLTQSVCQSGPLMEDIDLAAWDDILNSTQE